jgi:rod shape-determining protein MreC
VLGLVVISVTLMTVDHATDWLDETRATMTLAVTPVVVMADLPNRSAEGISQMFASREDMRQRITSLESELVLLRVKTEKMAALTAENNRLRTLLGSAAKLQENVLVAELVGVDPDPEKQQVIIDKGGIDDVYVGQPVLDAQGLMGQVIEVSNYTSRVLLISDETHSVPVQVLRNNLRLIAQGTGIDRQMVLLHVNATADIQVGDQLLSSGLGNRFPVGYPVGVVDFVDHEPGEPFARVTANPSARLDRSRHVLLVFNESETPRSVEDTESGKEDGSSGDK